MALIEFDRVTKRYNRTVAVDDLTLRIEPGEIYAFLGPNGAGKTTTIKMMVGLLRPDAGSVHVCGHAMGLNGKQAKARIAYVPDQPFLYDKLTGREFLEFVGRMYGMGLREIRQRGAMLGERLGLGDWLDQYSESYSHGMKQRVVLASAMLHSPSVLIVDEPMVGLDPVTMRAVKGLFRDVRNEGGAVFLSTHTLDTAEDLADRIGIINRSRMVAEGTLAQLQARTGRDDRLEEIFLTLLEEGAMTEGGEGAAT